MISCDLFFRAHFLLLSAEADRLFIWVNLFDFVFCIFLYVFIYLFYSLLYSEVDYVCIALYRILLFLLG
ncbi:MAG: hypothetical protein BGP15_18740 [Sphingobacterium sp. 40-24]|nr:MAG: hypothetical protein BGP15_18740 [Sphingobacterium sp. 40-24]